MSYFLRESAALIAGLWIGLIIGVSFYAAPIKFTAQDLAYQDLLLVGYVTFHGFTWVEFSTFGILTLCSLIHLSRPIILSGLSLLILLVIQKFMVLPQFDEVLHQVIEGQDRKRNYLHYLYGALDLIKIGTLITLFLFYRQNNTSEKQKVIPTS